MVGMRTYGWLGSLGEAWVHWEMRAERVSPGPAGGNAGKATGGKGGRKFRSWSWHIISYIIEDCGTNFRSSLRIFEAFVDRWRVLMGFQWSGRKGI